jgi:SAP domain
MFFKPDGTLLIQIQIAILGIVLIAGLLYLWRIILRLEERIDKLYKNNVAASIPPFAIPPQFVNENSPEELAVAQELMQQVFGGNNNGVNVNNIGVNNGMPNMFNPISLAMEQGPTMMMFSAQIPMHEEMNNVSKCSVEEIPNEDEKFEQIKETLVKTETVLEGNPEEIKADNKHVQREHVDNEERDEGITIASEEDDVNPISKSKLAQMKIEKLRKLCNDRGLSTEGLKPQLIERLLGLSRE